MILGIRWTFLITMSSMFPYFNQTSTYTEKLLLTITFLLGFGLYELMAINSKGGQ